MEGKSAKGVTVVEGCSISACVRYLRVLDLANPDFPMTTSTRDRRGDLFTAAVCFCGQRVDVESAEQPQGANLNESCVRVSWGL